MTLLPEAPRVLVQGATGREARMVVEHMVAYGTDVRAGVTPGRGGATVAGVPIFDAVAEAVAAVGPLDATLVSVPPAATLDAIEEALAAGVRMLVVATEHVPVRDAMRALWLAREAGAVVVGPNSVGVIAPGRRVKIGAIGGDRADRAFAPGPVGIISRSGGLTVEVALQLRLAGIGVSTAVSIGGDALTGLSAADAARLLGADPETSMLVVIGEPGTRQELDLAEAVAAGAIRLPVVAHVPGTFVERFPRGTRFGHAGAVVRAGAETPTAKRAALAAAGVHVAHTFDEIVPLVRPLVTLLSARIGTFERGSP